MDRPKRSKYAEMIETAKQSMSDQQSSADRSDQISRSGGSEFELSVRKIARPMGKSRNPEFTQIGAYIRKSTKKATDIRLLHEGTQDLSDLVQTLLEQWLTS